MGKSDKLSVGKNSELESIDGSIINRIEPRPIYNQVMVNFDLLTSSYGITLSQETQSDLGHLIHAIDLVDGYLDNLGSAQKRLFFTTDLLDYLRNMEFKLPNELPKSLLVTVEELRQVIHDRDIVEPFSLSLESIFLHTESKRLAEDIPTFLQHIRDEGVATAQLPLLIIGKIENLAFTSMFLKMCQSMGIADLLIDAREDYQNGLNPIKPRANLYFSILKDLIPTGCNIFWAFPNKINLIKYLGKMIYFLLKGS